MNLSTSQKTINTDKDGFLVNLPDWNVQVAKELAIREKIILAEAHWEIIHLVREFYRKYEHSPEMRPLVKFCKLQLGDNKGSSIYLLSLFPGSPAKLACKIAGLPRPANCL